MHSFAVEQILIFYTRHTCPLPLKGLGLYTGCRPRPTTQYDFSFCASVVCSATSPNVHDRLNVRHGLRRISTVWSKPVMETSIKVDGLLHRTILNSCGVTCATSTISMISATFCGTFFGVDTLTDCSGWARSSLSDWVASSWKLGFGIFLFCNQPPVVNDCFCVFLGAW